MSGKTIAEALAHVAAHPAPPEAPIDAPCWELVCRNLYDCATSPDTSARGWQAKSNRAQQMITERKVGRRRPGTKPVRAGSSQVEFTDLTAGAIEGGTREL